MNTSKSRPGNHLAHGRIPELDGIRAIAILLVIGCHYWGFCRLMWGLPAFGWVGVDIFFVLSGFLITSILIELRRTESPIKTFYVRRVLRIFPIYYLMILLVSVASLAYREHMVHAGWYVSRFLYLQSFRDSPALFREAFQRLAGLKPQMSVLRRQPLPPALPGATVGPWANSLGAAWSLSVEEYFYILWAPIVIFLKSPRKIAAAAAAIFVLSAVVRYLGFGGLDDYLEFFCRVDPIMAGAALALFMKWRGRLQPESQNRWDRSAIALALLLGGLLVGIFIYIHPVVGREVRESPLFTVVGMPALAVLFAIALGWVVLHQSGSSILLRILRLRPVRYLGTISYSLYLFHFPVYCCFIHLAGLIRFSGYFADLSVSVAALALSISLSALSWRYFETPILNLKERWAPTRARVRLETVVN